MVNNKQLKKEVFALYAGVSIEKFSAKYYGKVNEEIMSVPKELFTEIESDIMMWPTSPLSHKADSANLTLEETAPIEKNALIKLRNYKIKEFRKLRQWDNEIYAQIKNYAYEISLIGAQALEYLQKQTQKFIEEIDNKEEKSQLIQMVLGTIAVNEHYKRTPLEKLGLDTHMYNVLRRLGIKNAMDISQYSTKDILGQSQIGENSVKKLQAKLKKLGLILR